MPYSFIQISDCHLFKNKEALHHGANVYNNLSRVLEHISYMPETLFVVFTGDLTQDHQEKSYQLFTELIHQWIPNTPVYFLAGNHDEHYLLNKFLVGKPFEQGKTINVGQWQVQLVDSKSESPAGIWTEKEKVRLQSVMDDKHQFVLMHHHATNVGYFIDRHGLENRNAFFQFIAKYKNIKALGCGHVHNAMKINVPIANIPLFTCPATSIQFDKAVPTVANANIGPGFRVFTIDVDNQLTSDVVFLNDE